MEDEPQTLQTFNPRKPQSNPIPTVGQWEPILESECTFEQDAFLRVMHNLIKNPNIMSSHLFRADIFYDSEKDHTIIEKPGHAEFSEFTRHMKQDYRPQFVDVAGYKWQRTYVRQLVPRNRQLDKDLVQSCHFYVQQEDQTTRHIILYVPHVQTPEDMPWYHPKVQIVAFFYSWTCKPTSSQAPGLVSVHYSLYPNTQLDTRLERTALQLLTKIHKHGRGQQAGYQKRVHHDQVVPQQRFQDTYARLKAKYAKTLMANWVEETDPGKHVFEDLGIASFLMELWADMYDCSNVLAKSEDITTTTSSGEKKPPFPGFVDIGCGNGLLVNILNLEGFSGWGFDARQRKTWKTFSTDIQKQVKEMVLVPEILDPEDSLNDDTDSSDVLAERRFHNGVFEPSTFIVSNHADELTPWTPLLAHVNDSPFIAIPCCSHNLSGARWRAPVSKSHKAKSVAAVAQSTQQTKPETDALRQTQAAETGTLKKPGGNKNVQSAYGSLCDYVVELAEEVGFVAEREVLRIPSTRNVCILGRTRKKQDAKTNSQDRSEQIRNIVARQLNAPIEDICKDWVTQAKRIAGKKGDGH